ncbi:MAG TPA: DUF1028 domain-containing protein [Burkholderiales bacterium]|nr:DUF1028 domain-containing protein [Burkholderiales bacterium]
MPAAHPQSLITNRQSRLSCALALLLAVAGTSGTTVGAESEPEGTFSIIARDSAPGELGMAVHSKAHAVGSRTISAKGGVAVIAHQATSNPMYGQVGLELLQRGMTPQQALDYMVRADEGRDNRQVSILDMQGRSASWTGSRPQDWKGHRCTPDYCVQGNILAGPQVLDGMARNFEAAAGQPLAERLLAALDGGQAAGGDRRGMQSAALTIVKPLAGAAGFSDRIMEFRVDDHRSPIVELRRVLNVFRGNQLIAEANRHLQGNRQDEALRTAIAARDLAPDSDNAWVGLANVYLKLGQKSESLAALRRAIELNPAHRSELPKNANFESIRSDPEFRKMTD